MHSIGWIEFNSGNKEKGEAFIQEGLKIFEQLEDSLRIMWALLNLGTVLRFQGDLDQARRCYERGMQLAKSSNDELAIASFKRGLAMIAADEGRLIEAKDGLEAIIPILREQNQLILAGALGNLAVVNHRLGRFEAAFDIGHEGLELAREMKKWYTFRWILKALAETEFERSNYESSLSFAQQALEFSERFGLFSAEIEELKTLIQASQKRLSL